jgi:hypothetical protein
MLDDSEIASSDLYYSGMYTSNFYLTKKAGLPIDIRRQSRSLNEPFPLRADCVPEEMTDSAALL